MSSNKVATIILFDVGSLTSDLCESETFFKKAQWSVLRMIQRKIFSCENDEIAVILFGSEETENNLYHCSDDDRLYNNIQVYSALQLATWELYEQVQMLKISEVKNSNWVEGLLVSLDLMKEKTKGKRFKDKQIIVFSNFAMKLKHDENKINLLAENINLDNIKLITIGLDLEEECKGKVVDSQLSGSKGIIFSLIDKVENGVPLSFIEAEEDIRYYDKKRKTSRFSKVNLTIGSKINIPLRWIKITLEPTRLKWVRKHPVQTDDYDHEKTSEPEIKYVMETQRVTKFGNSDILLNYADMEAMKRQSGPASCILLGCVKRQRVNRELFVGSDVYLAVPEKNASAQTMISAFIDALIESDKYALVRRVTTTNGKVKVGVLIPVSDEAGKMFYFLQLPFAEYALVVPDVVLPEPDNKEIMESLDNIIDSMTIPDKPKDVPMKDPTFQLRCHILSLCENGKLQEHTSRSSIPDYIKKLFDPYPELEKEALPYIEKIEKLIPIDIDKNLLDTDELDEISNGAGENIKEGDSRITIKEENMDWENAETQDWPEELKKHFLSPTKVNLETPHIVLKDMLSKNKYDTNYVLDRLLKDHGPTENKLSGESSNKKKYNPEIQEMLDQRQNTEVDVDTNEMLQRLRDKLENR